MAQPLRRVRLEPAESCHLVAGAVGRAWRAHRRHVPTDVKDLMAELLLALRVHILSKDVTTSRYDIRGVAELLKQLLDSITHGRRDLHDHDRYSRVDTVCECKCVRFGRRGREWGAARALGWHAGDCPNSGCRREQLHCAGQGPSQQAQGAHRFAVRAICQLKARGDGMRDEGER